MVKGGITYRYITDQLGSVRLVVDAATGAIAQRIDYDEYGVTIQDTNPGFQPFGFAGGITDAHTRLVRFGARDFDPVSGRWASEDLPMFLSVFPNRYEYVLGNPLAANDPAGLGILDCIKCSYYKVECADEATQCVSPLRATEGRGDIDALLREIEWGGSGSFSGAHFKKCMLIHQLAGK